MIDIEVNLNGNTITLMVFECEFCKGAIGIDATYIDQVSEEIKCPYCNQTNKMKEGW